MTMKSIFTHHRGFKPLMLSVVFIAEILAGVAAEGWAQVMVALDGKRISKEHFATCLTEVNSIITLKVTAGHCTTEEWNTMATMRHSSLKNLEELEFTKNAQIDDVLERSLS